MTTSNTASKAVGTRAIDPEEARTEDVDAEDTAHAQIDKDAGPSWSSLDDDERRLMEARGYKPGWQPMPVWRDGTPRPE